MKTLKIGAYTLDGTLWAEEEVLKAENGYSKALRESESVWIGHGWYLHGKLMEEIGYDLAEFLNLKEDMVTITKDRYSEYHTACLKEGIYDVEVVGIDKPCIGYFWTSNRAGDPRTTGLVCFKDDKEACEYAAQKYAERSSTL